MQIDQNELNDIINSLGNGKAIGFAEVSNEMWKYGCGTGLEIWVKIIFEKMIETGEMPYLFNVGKIMPITKDPEKERNLKNLRPITISDSLANIFEITILRNVDKSISCKAKRTAISKTVLHKRR
jgi:hypothetical protein